MFPANNLFPNVTAIKTVLFELPVKLLKVQTHDVNVPAVKVNIGGEFYRASDRNTFTVKVFWTTEGGFLTFITLKLIKVAKGDGLKINIVLAAVFTV